MTGLDDQRPTALVWLLRAAVRHYGAVVRPALDAAGFGDIPQRGIWALSAIAEAPRTTVELVDVLIITKQAVSQTVDALVQFGYVDRQPDPDDGRRVRLVPTARGVEAAGVIDAACADVQHQLSTRVGASGATQLRHLLGEVPKTTRGVVTDGPAG